MNVVEAPVEKKGRDFSKQKGKEKNSFIADQFLSSIVSFKSSLTIETADQDKICITFQGAEIDALQNSFLEFLGDIRRETLLTLGTTDDCGMEFFIRDIKVEKSREKLCNNDGLYELLYL